MQRNPMQQRVRLLFALSILCIFLSTLPNALALTSTLSLPATAQEGTQVSIMFSADEPNATFVLYRNNVQVATTSPYLWQTDYDDAGLYTYRLETPGAANVEKTIEILDVPLTFTVHEPSQSEYTTQTVPIELTTNVAVDFCYYVLGAQSNTLTANGLTHTGSITLADGVHSLELKCKKGTTLVTQEKTLLVDTTPPVIESISPTQGASLQAQSATLQIITDEVAQCFYWQASQAESTKKQMQANDGITHTALVTGEQDHSYLFRCQDVHANAMTQTQEVEFFLNTPPSAEIELFVDGEVNDPQDPLKQGSYDLIVRTSEEVITAPLLSYTYQNGGTHSVTLEQDATDKTKWEGFLSIPQTAKEDAASFSITLKDTTNVVGTTITKGSIFLVDTIVPLEVSQPAATLISLGTKNGIRVSWVDEQAEDELSYVLYRSVFERITKSDELIEVDSQVYIDSSVQEGQTYYYAIAAKDTAGNIGPLSRVVSATLTPKNPLAKDPKKSFAVDELQTRLAKGILDLETAKTTLEQETNPEKLLLIEKAHLLENVLTLLETLRVQEEYLDSLPSVSTDAFTTQLEEINDLLTQVNAVIPNFIEIISVSDFTEPSDVRAQNTVFEKISIIFPQATALMQDTKQKIAYQNTFQELMQNVRVSGKVVIGSVTFSNRETKQYTSIAKEVSLPTGAPRTLIEVLPSVFAQKNIVASSLEWSKEPIILPSEDMVVFALSGQESAFSYSYFFTEHVDVVSAKATRALVLPEPAVQQSGVSNSITGNFIAQSFQSGSNIVYYGFAVFLIAGLLVYYFFMDGPVQGPAQTFSQGGLEQLTQAITQAITSANSPAQSVRMSQEPLYNKRSLPPLAKGITQPLFTRAVMNNPFTPSTTIASGEQQSVAQRITKAHEAIDNNEYIDAKQLYLHALEENTQESGAFSAQTQELYYKLLLYKQLRLAELAANTQNAQELTNSLASLQSIAQKLPQEQTPLIVQAQEQYRSFSRLANRLAIEQNRL